MRFAMIGFAVATVTWLGTGAAGRHSSRHSVSASSERQSERWNWHGRVERGKTIEIHGVSGDILAEPSTGDEVEVSAVKRGRRSDPEEVRIEVVEHDGGVTICAVYPGPNNRCYAGGSRSNTRNNDVEVTWTVRVPRGVGFEGNAVNGDVETGEMTGPVSASSVNGSVRIETTSGEANGESVNGSVTAVVHAIGQGDMSFKSVNGAVNVTLPAGIDMNLEAETVNGSINTDFPITVNGRMNPRHIAGAIGRGGRRLSLETVNGSIRLRKLP